MPGIEADLQHPLPSLAEGPVDSHNVRGGSLVQSASHLAREYPLLLDHSIAALDPLYALWPIFRFAATTSNHVLSIIMRRYELISSTLWDPDLSKEYKGYMNQLILHKHLLDDHAARHEEVLRYLRSPQLKRWAMQLSREQKQVADRAKNAVIADFEYLLARFRTSAENHHVAINILTSAAALNESKKQIDLATQVTKLTVLATVFLPLSFVTGLFGMNFVELEGLSIYVWAVVTAAIGLVTLAVYKWDDVRTWVGELRRRRARAETRQMNMEV
jgi:Mg2+ and Co2+ transporter CorA